MLLHLTIVKKSFFLVVFCLYAFWSGAQPVCELAIQGIVYDGETNEPFVGASVLVKELGKGMLTDAKGQFEIRGLCPEANYTLVYAMIGYKTYVGHYHLHTSVMEKIILHTDTCELESVTILGKRPEELAAFTKSTLSGKDLDKTRGLSLGDALKELPGVTVFKTGSSIAKPMIHGLHSNRILVLNAGLRQEGQQWGNEHAPEVDPFVSDKLTVVKGAAGVRYGSDALGGVVIVEPRSLPTEKSLGAEFNLAGMSNNRQGTAAGLLEGKLGTVFPLSWRLQGTWKKAGNTKTPYYYQANTGFEELNYSYALGFVKKKYGLDLFYSQFTTTLGVFAGAHMGNREDLLQAIQRARPAVAGGFDYAIGRPFQQVEHELARIKGWWQLGSVGKLSMQVGRQFNDRSEYDVLRSAAANARRDNPQLQFKLTSHSADAWLDHRAIGRFSGAAGVSYFRQANVWQGRFLIPNFRNEGWGAFVLEKWANGRLSVEGGLRVDTKWLDVYQNERGTIVQLPHRFQNFSGSLGIDYKVNEHIQWKSNGGTTWRPPTVNELYSAGLHQGTGTYENGNPDLGPEQAYKMVNGVEMITKKLALELTCHYNYIANYLYLKPDIIWVETTEGLAPVQIYKQLVQGYFPSFTYSQTDAHFYGADFSANYAVWKNLDLLLKNTLVFSKDLRNTTYLIYTPPVRSSISVKKSFTDGKFGKYSPYVSATFYRVERQTRYNPNTDFADPPAAYQLFDAEVGAEFPIGKQRINCSLQANNLFDTAYRDYLNRFRYYTDEMGRNIVLRIKVPLALSH